MDKFCNLLYKKDEVIEVRILPGITNNGKKPKSFFFKKDKALLKDITDVIKSCNKDYNIYFGVMPRKKKGDTKEISRINACFLDIDKKEFAGEEEFNKYIDLLEKKILPSLKLNFTTKIFTGNGFHYYFIFTHKENIQPEVWKEIQCALIEFCHGDKQVKDLPRILRIPSSKNIKDPGNLKNCNIIQLNEKNLLSVSDFDTLLSRYRQLLRRKEQERAANKTYQDYSGEKKDFVTAVIQTLTEAGGGLFSDRSDYLRFCYACKSAGLHYDQIDPILSQSDNYNYDKNLKEYEKLAPSKVDFGTAYYFAEKANNTRLKELLGAGRKQEFNNPPPVKHTPENIPFPTDADVPGMDVKVAKETKPLPPAPQQNIERIETFTLEELTKKEFEPIKWLVEGIMPEGLTILMGKPKVGKSFLALNLAFSIARGSATLGHLKTEKSGVLYLAIDDKSDRRLQKRTSPIVDKIKEMGEKIPEGLEFSLNMKTLQDGGLEQLQELISRKPHIKLIVIDVFQKIRKVVKSVGNAYEMDTDFLTKIHDFCEANKVSILLLHHTKKVKEADFIDDCSGSTGITGGVDTILKLSRCRKEDEAILEVTGRDLEQEQDLALRFNKDLLSWELIGEANCVKQSRERQEIIDLIKDEGRAMRDKEIAEILGKTYDATRRITWQLSKEGQLSQEKRGYYNISSYKYKNIYHSNSSNNNNSSNHSNSNIYCDLNSEDRLTVNPEYLQGKEGQNGVTAITVIPCVKKEFNPSDLLREYKQKYNKLLARRGKVLSEIQNNPDYETRLLKELEVTNGTLERLLCDIKHVYKYTDEEVRHGFKFETYKEKELF